MVQILREIGVWVGTGPLAPVAIVLGFITTIAALIILILELSGRTISGFKLVPSTFKWDRKAVIVLVAVTVFVMLIDPVRFDFIQILQRGPRLAPSLAPVIAVIFGLPGVLGFMLAVFINNLIQGGVTGATIFVGLWSALAWVWVTWLPYRAVGRLNFDNTSAALGTLGKFYLWGVLIGPLLHVWSSPVLQVLQGGEGAAVWGRMVPMIAINHDAPLLIIGPIAIAILYPLAKLAEVYWPDRQQEQAEPIPA